MIYGDFISERKFNTNFGPGVDQRIAVMTTAIFTKNTMIIEPKVLFSANRI